MAKTLKKGAFFTMDALVALSLMAAAFVLVVNIGEPAVSEQSAFEQIHFTAEDALQVFTNSPFSSLDQATQDDILASTNVTATDVNKSLPDIIGTLWAYGEEEYALNLTKDFLEPLIPAGYGYSLSIGDGSSSTIIYNSSSPSRQNAEKIASTFRLISGYEEDVPSKSYVASAWATELKRNVTKVFPFSLAGAGWWGNNFTVEKYINISDDAEIYDVNLRLSIHYYPSVSGNWVEGIWVNDVYVESSSIDWIYNVYSAGFGYGGYGIFNTTAFKSQFQPGPNKIKIVFNNPEYNAHIHPGMKLTVKYSSEGLFDPLQKKFYFDDSRGMTTTWRTAAWEVLPFHIPKGANLTNASIHIEGEDVDRRAYIWVNDQEILYDNSPPNDPVYDFGLSDFVDYLNVNQTGGDYISTGETNTVAVYFDITPSGNLPLRWTYDYARIRNTSYVDVNYTTSETLRYATVEVTDEQEFDNGAPELTKKANFSLPDYDITKAFVHIAQYYSWKVAIAAWNNGETEPSWTGSNWDNYQIFKSATARAVPSDIYVPLDRLKKNETNYIKARDGFDGGSSGNFILPESTLEYSILVPSQVGYGDNFPTEQEAITDANSRLNQTLGQYAEATSIENDAISMSQVPWMWGPAILRMEVWK